MKHLELKQLIYFCDKYVISPNELVLLEIILLAQEEEETEIINSYFKSRFKGSTIELLTNLQNKGVILKTWKIPNKGETLDINSIPINKNLVKDFYKSSFEMGQQLWDVYPQFAIINGNTVSLRAVAKRFDSIEDAYAYYGKQIRHKPETHKRIIELVKWASDNGILNCTFASFIIDHKWEALEAMQNGTESNINFDSFKLV